MQLHREDGPLRGSFEGLTHAVASYCAGTSFDDLPPTVVERAKWVVLDEIGCMVLGSTMKPGQVMRGYVVDLGGKPASTIFGSTAKAPTSMAALVNGTAGHADELDGAHLTEGHPGATIVSACYAAAEAENASGADLINAICLGYDVGTRLVVSIGGRLNALTNRHVHSDVVHALGAAAGVGRLLRLDADGFVHALALAGYLVNMPAAFFAEREHMSKALNCGQAAYAGVTAAALAQRGFTGHDDILRHGDGVLAMWSEAPDFAAVTEGLGDEYAILRANFKFYSAGYPIHAPLVASLEVMQAHGLSCDDLAGIEVHMTTNTAIVVQGRAMPSININDMLSLGVVLGRLDFEDAHDESNLELPQVRRLRERITVVRDKDLDAANARGREAWVEITTTDGRRLRSETALPPGHCLRGDATWAKLETKFVRLTENRLLPGAGARAAALLADLEHAPDLGEVSRLLGSTAPGETDALVSAADRV